MPPLGVAVQLGSTLSKRSTAIGTPHRMGPDAGISLFLSGLLLYLGTPHLVAAEVVFLHL